MKHEGCAHEEDWGDQHNPTHGIISQRGLIVLSEDRGFTRLDKTAFSVAPAFDESDLREYWHSRTPAERLEYMEILRRMNYGDKATAGLQRVFEIAERE